MCKCWISGYQWDWIVGKLLVSFKAKCTGHISEKIKSLTVPPQYEKCNFATATKWFDKGAVYFHEQRISISKLQLMM